MLGGVPEPTRVWDWAGLKTEGSHRRPEDAPGVWEDPRAEPSRGPGVRLTPGWGGCPAPASQSLLSVRPWQPALSFQMPASSLLFPARTPSQVLQAGNKVARDPSCSADSDLSFAAQTPGSTMHRPTSL